MSTVPEVSRDDWMGSVMDGAFTLAIFAGFAAGPAGLVLAGGATILQQVLHSLSSDKQHISESEIVDSVLRDELTELEIQSALASFQTTYQWFENYYLSKWSDDDSKSTPEEIAEFRTNLSAALGPNSMFLTFLNLLQAKRYEAPGFTPFMIGAALHVVLLKIDLILKSTDRRVVDTPALQPLIEFLGSHADHAQSAMKTIDDLIAQRVKQIGNPARKNDKWEFVDTGNTARNRNGEKYTFDNELDAKTMHDVIVTKITTQQQREYYGGRRDKAAASVKQWQEAQKKYKDLQPA